MPLGERKRGHQLTRGGTAVLQRILPAGHRGGFVVTRCVHPRSWVDWDRLSPPSYAPKWSSVTIFAIGGFCQCILSRFADRDETARPGKSRNRWQRALGCSAIEEGWPLLSSPTRFIGPFPLHPSCDVFGGGGSCHDCFMPRLLAKRC